MPEKSVMPVGREALPSRRTVVRTAAWTLPAVTALSAAPAFATTPGACTTYTVASVPFFSGTSTVGGTRRSTWSMSTTGTGAPMPLLVSAAATTTGDVRLGGSQSSTTNDNFRGYANVGGVGQGLCLHQARTTTSGTPARDHRVAYKFTFAQPVKNLSFYITDIDYGSNDYSDRVELSGAFTVSRPFTNNDVSGAGTVADPLRPSGTNAHNDWNSSRGTVLVTYAGEVTEFTLTYWNALTSMSGSVDRDQAVYVAGMKFDYEICTS